MKRNRTDLLIVSAIVGAIGLGCSGLPNIQTQQQQQPTQPPPAATPAATPDTEKAELLDKLNELEKKIDEQKKNNPPPATIRPGVTTARVFSPGDGFLAMRSDPSSNVGYRILQIPHGATVRVNSCQSYRQTVGGRGGRWCYVSYGGSSGWAFDGWLVY